MNITLENGISLQLNKKDCTAKIVASPKAHGSILIPKTINYESINYIVKSIDESAFMHNKNITTVTILEDSELDLINKKAFYGSSIESIIISSHVNQIGPEAFSNCENFKTITFSKDSELQSISEEMFSFTSIESIVIPSKVTHICESAFRNCIYLKTIEIPANSELRSIGKSAFCFTKIKSLYFPSKLESLNEGWCSNIDSLVQIDISNENKFFSFYENNFIIKKNDEKKDDYQDLVFARRDIIEATIPASIEHICSFCFDECDQLRTINFEKNSKLQRIEKYAFYNASIEEIEIPSSVKTLCEFAFFECNRLKSVHFTGKSQLKTIEKGVFLRSAIESLIFQSKVQILEDGWCCSTPNLVNIEVSSDNKYFSVYEKTFLVAKDDEQKDDFQMLVFARRDIIESTIPASIEIICSYCFDECNKLQTINFENNSKLQIIDQYAFYNTGLKSIEIPSSVTTIETRAFSDCIHLKSIVVLKENEPVGVKDILYESFRNCYDLACCEFLGDEIRFGKNIFYGCSNLFITSFPVSNNVIIYNDSFSGVSSQFSLFVSVNCNFQIIESYTQ